MAKLVVEISRFVKICDITCGARGTSGKDSRKLKGC